MRVSTRIATTHQQREQERCWIEACHPSWGQVLMEIAGRSTAESAIALWEGNPGSVEIFCGPGNNGGDGMVVARYLHLCGIKVNVHLVVGPGKTAKRIGEGSVNQGILDKLGVHPKIVLEDQMGEVVSALASSAVVVDALLGTGLDRPVDGVYRKVIDAINDSGRPVLSVDLPSGVHSDTGQVMGCAVAADCTVTFGYLKAGLLSHPGADLAGKITVVDIGLPALDHELFSLEDKSRWWLSTSERVGWSLPSRPDDSHKGSFGSLLSICGSLGMTGASILTAMSGLRAGAGLSILAAPASIVPNLPVLELIYKGLDETDKHSISAKAISALMPEIERASAVVLGPGISTHPDTVQFVHELVKLITKSCVIDADGLNALAQNPEAWGDRSSNFVFTPHPKELSRLIGMTTAEIQANRIVAAQKAQDRFGCIIVLKGSRTVVAGPHQTVYINPTGNSGMSTAGAGDVLAGVIGSLLAQGLSPFEAAVSGAYIHGAAGDHAVGRIGETGIVAGDIMDSLPSVLTQLYNGDYPGSELERQIFHLDS